MEQLIKIAVAMLVILFMVGGLGLYFFKKNSTPINQKVQESAPVVNPELSQIKTPTLAPTVVLENQSKETQAPAESVTPPAQVEVQTQSQVVVEGKLTAIGEKKIILELADGKSVALSITPTVAVSSEVNAEAKNLSFLKIGNTLSVKTDSKGGALEILIKK